SLLGTFTLALLVAPAVAAKPAEKPPTDSTVRDGATQGGAFFENVNVDIINVEVFVTDKAGNPVKGLKQEDFQILEDGRPVAISNFYSGDTSGKPRSLMPLLPPPPNAAVKPGAPPAPEPAPD